ncbi:MAG: ABC transporter permease [Candidatus Nanopelagicales bacterium]|nr:ABC transporter permease [Candidatus Nanopelagicales bacterium]
MSRAAATQDRPKQVYLPHRAGLPRLTTYVATLWSRRHFAAELSSATMRAAHTNTFFGQFWLVISPALNAAVYFMLVNVIRGGSAGPDFFMHLLAGLFAFTFIQTVVTNGADSVVKGGNLVLNTAFPLLLLPFSALRTAFLRFLPTMGILLAFFVYFDYFGPHSDSCDAITGACSPLNTIHFSPVQFLAIPAFALLFVFAMGLSALMATLQVYFRDTSQLLPYATRIWLYLSPVLYYADQMQPWMLKLEVLNPLFPMLTVWTDTLIRGVMPSTAMWLGSCAWALGSLLVGTFWFISREREFAVRI